MASFQGQVVTHPSAQLSPSSGSSTQLDTTALIKANTPLVTSLGPRSTSTSSPAQSDVSHLVPQNVYCIGQKGMKIKSVYHKNKALWQTTQKEYQYKEMQRLFSNAEIANNNNNQTKADEFRTKANDARRKMLEWSRKAQASTVAYNNCITGGYANPNSPYVAGRPPIVQEEVHTQVSTYSIPEVGIPSNGDVVSQGQVTTTTDAPGATTTTYAPPGQQVAPEAMYTSYAPAPVAPPSLMSGRNLIIAALVLGGGYVFFRRRA